MEITRGFNVDPSLDILSVPKCTCGNVIPYTELKSFSRPEYQKHYLKALDSAYQAVVAESSALRAVLEILREDSVALEFYRKLSRYPEARLEQEYRALRKVPNASLDLAYQTLLEELPRRKARAEVMTAWIGSALARKFYERLSAYEGARLQREYELLRDQNRYEFAFRQIGLRPCCRATVLAAEVVPNRISFNPEIESGQLDPSVDDEKVALKYVGHMKRGRFLKPRFENGFWYADTETERGVTKYEAETVVEWLEVPVPLFARNILRKASETATAVILPRLPGIPDPWETRKLPEDNSFTDLHREELRYLTFLRQYPDFREFANNYILDNYGIDQERYMQVYPIVPKTIPAKKKKELARALILVEKKTRDEALAFLRDKLPDESEEDLLFLLDTYQISTQEVNSFRAAAVTVYSEENHLTEEDLKRIEELEKEVNREWQEQVRSEKRATASRKVWANIAEFM